MASEMRTITGHLKSALAASHTVYDLSATDAVKVGRFTAPPGAVPFACVSPPSFDSDAADAPMGQYARRYTFDVMAWVAAGDDPETKALAATDLADDLATALEEDARTTGGGLFAMTSFRDLVVRGTGFDGDEADLAPGYAFVFLVVTVDARLSRGV